MPHYCESLVFRGCLKDLSYKQENNSIIEKVATESDESYQISKSDDNNAHEFIQQNEVDYTTEFPIQIKDLQQENNSIKKEVHSDYDECHQNFKSDNNHAPDFSQQNEVDFPLEFPVQKTNSTKKSFLNKTEDFVAKKQLQLEYNALNVLIEQSVFVYDSANLPHNRPTILRKHKENIFKCDYCEEKFPTVYTASLHIGYKHRDKKEEFDKKYKIYVCAKGECREAYYIVSSLHKHYRRFHGIHPRDISKYFVKGKYFGEKLDLTCKTCGKKYYHRINLEDHIEEHKVGLGTKLITCNICEKKFHYRSNLGKHLKLHAIEDTECSLCGIIVKTKHEMNKHRRKYHEKPCIKRKKKRREKNPLIQYKCNFCDFEASSRSTVSTHMYNNHNQGGIYCDHCGKKCPGQSNLKRHIEMVHEKGTFACNECERKFSCDVNLQRHRKNQHINNDDKPYKCTQCGKGFTKPIILEGHMNMHLGLKPYKCQFCGQGFQNDSNMRAHQKKTCKGMS